MIRKTIAATLVAVSLGSTVLPAYSAVYVKVAPPAPREEVVPAARPGYVWRGGYWDWRGNKHQWVKGTYVRERRGYHYVQPAWVEDKGRWKMRPGTWARGDRDGDGVPNSRDRAPSNPNKS
jgi:hypothetical protein